MTTHYAFEVSQRTFAIKLAGYRPNELFRNSTVRDWTRAYFGSIKGPDGFTAAGAANALMHDQPAEMSEEEFERRLLPIVTDLPTVVEGHALVKQYIAAEVARLKERQELMEYREARLRTASRDHPRQPRADITSDGEKRTRYYVMPIRAEHVRLVESCGRFKTQTAKDTVKAIMRNLPGPKRSAPGRGAGRAHDEATAVTEPAASETIEGVGFEGSDHADGPEKSVSGEVEEAPVNAVAGRAHDEATGTQVAVKAEGREEGPGISARAFKRSAQLSEAELEEEENYPVLIERFRARAESD